MTTAHLAIIEGFPVVEPNQVQEGEDFYISYNDYDIAIYGCATTALVKGQMEQFYILNGDHRKAYAPLIEKGFAACFDYFLQNINLISKHSNRPAAV